LTHWNKCKVTHHNLTCECYCCKILHIILLHITVHAYSISTYHVANLRPFTPQTSEMWKVHCYISLVFAKLLFTYLDYRVVYTDWCFVYGLTGCTFVCETNFFPPLVAVWFQQHLNAWTVCCVLGTSCSFVLKLGNVTFPG
jgi:hypothetical protein